MRYLDLGSPVMGRLPVISPAGQHVGSLELRLEVQFHVNQTVSSFELQEHLSARAAAQQASAAHGPAGSQQPAASAAPPDTAQDYEAVLEQLDLFDVLHSRLSR